jgi:hypothetical protein
VWASYTSPDNSDFGSLPLSLRPEYIGDALSKVVLSILLVGDTLDLNEGCVWAGVAFGALVTQNATFGV